MPVIVHVISGLDPGGAETMLVRLAGALRERGFEQHVISIRGWAACADQLEKVGIPVTALNVTSLWTAPAAIVRAVNVVRRLAPDVLQGWMYHGDLMAAVLHTLVPGRRRRRLFWSLRASNMDTKRYGWIVRLCALLSPWPSLVIANSHAGAKFHIARGYRPRRLEVVPNGIDVGKLRPDPAAREEVRREFGIPSHAIVAIHVARLDPMKDHTAFLNAMRNVPEVVGICAGRGTRGLPLPANVLALGERGDLERLYAAADTVVSSSAFGEGFSNILAEGMSSGLIPIATDVGDARSIVGDAGTIVEPRSPSAIADAIRAIAKLSEAERNTGGRIARERIVENFSLARAAGRFAELYANDQHPGHPEPSI